MVQGRQILMFYTNILHNIIADDCGHKILRFWANPQKYQTLVPAKNSHLKVTNFCRGRPGYEASQQNIEIHGKAQVRGYHQNVKFYTHKD